MLQAAHPIKANRPLKPRKCRHCKEPFIRLRPLQRVCGWECGLEVAKQIAEKQERKQAAADRKEVKRRLEAMLPLSYWAKQAQAAFNAWIRTRDAGLPCISCGRQHGGKVNAGHFLSTGARPELRFCEENCHLQCEPCNTHLAGNLIPYRAELIRRIGADRVAWLEGPHEPKRYRADELKAIRDIYRARVKAAT